MMDRYDTRTIEDQATELVARAYQVLSTGNLDELDALVAGDFIEHHPRAGTPQGLEGFKARVAELRQGFPDLVCAIDSLTAQGDRVGVQYRLYGTHRGAYHGVAATGKRVVVDNVDVIRLAGGKLVERWSNPNDLGLYQQLGAVLSERPRI